MTLEEEVQARLAEWPGVLQTPGLRVFALEAPADQPPPYMVHRRNYTTTAAAFDGRDMPRARFEVECVGVSFKQANALATLAIEALDNWTADSPATLASASFEDLEFQREAGLVVAFADFDLLYRK